MYPQYIWHLYSFYVKNGMFCCFIQVLRWLPVFYIVSGWLLFNNESAFFSTILWREQVIFNEMMMMSALYQTTINWIFIVLAHSDTLSRFQANQSLFLLLKTGCFVEKQQIPIVFPLVWLDQGSKPTIHCILGKHAKPLHHQCTFFLLCVADHY
jgi:hypothetical protein